jgi:endonuclease-3 related protein
MATFDDSLPAIEAALEQRYGGLPSSIAHTDGAFSAILAVVLGRFAAPRKVAKVIEDLKESALLDSRTLAETEADEVVETFRAAGVANPSRAFGPIRRVARWLEERHGGDAEVLREGHIATSLLREELAELNGIGPATADAILLFALRRPSYPVDRASYRILLRHGWLSPWDDYDQARAAVVRPLADAPERLAFLSESLERIGREFCRASGPRCDACPLRPLLPEDGPRLPEID